MPLKNEHLSSKLPASRVYTLSVTPLGSRIVVLVLVALLVGLLQFLLKTPLNILDERLGSLNWQLNTDTETERRLIIVAIDEKSLQEVGSWPWSRATLAKLSDQLQAYGASSQIYDLVFPEARTDDALLAETFKKNRALIAQIPLLNSTQQTGVASTAFSAQCHEAMPVATGILGNSSSLSYRSNLQDNMSIPAGHITPTVDSDGAVRFQAPFICYQGQAYPSLALAALLHNLQIDQLEWKKAPSLFSLEPDWTLVAPNYPLLQVPLNTLGEMRVNYAKSPSSFITLSAADVLAQRIDPKWLQNNWVLIGATAFSLGDLVPSPHSGLTPGIEIQARLITSLLDQEIPYTPAAQSLYHGVLGLLQAVLLIALASLIGQHRYAFARACLLSTPIVLPLLVLALHQWMISYQLWLGWLPSALFGTIAALSIIALEYLRNRQERQRLYDNLSSYLPESIANEIAFHAPSEQVQARERHFIVLNADLRNFSAYQQQRPAEETALLLHCFFSIATRVIEENKGTVYELHADSLLAVWPLEAPLVAVPQPSNNNPADVAQGQHAYQASQQLHQSLQALLDRPLPETLEPLALGVGIAAGSVTEGTLGAAGRRTQMLLGETVTLALRIQSMTAELAYPTLCNDSFAKLLPVAQKQNVGRYLLEGLTQPRALYSLKTSGKVAQLFPEHKSEHSG
ncbi:sensor domain CHASE2-containing protein [Oceanospirillum multiglobuliferum]|uniref:CHASE2 domain-containing protein n=1 Tax=Oceanospirillum multiglobuliferum TaxID=64969 RepID=UPI000999848D|nr:adenylate/guanylate cyclase domain-containing protein [Oceanospirillum multiglobuliferum]SJZ99620.1 sensor domain CHASE2-containing protein [Oceanospirillum multiglobuliferum]